MWCRASRGQRWPSLSVCLSVGVCVCLSGKRAERLLLSGASVAVLLAVPGLGVGAYLSGSDEPTCTSALQVCTGAPAVSGTRFNPLRAVHTAPGEPHKHFTSHSVGNRSAELTNYGCKALLFFVEKLTYILP